MPGLRQILELVEHSLDEPELAPAELAARAYLSRFHFDRLARAALDEPLGALRRRLFLERAAHRLASTTDRVIDIGAAAGYGSPDAFTRAFVRAYGMTPSAYRHHPRPTHDLPAGNGIHFHPPGGLRLPAERRSSTMDVLTRMYDHHIETTGAVLDRIAGVPDDVLDRPIESSVEGIDEDPTLRRVCERLVRQLEMWNAAIEGGTEVPAGPNSAEGLQARLDAAAPDFRTLVLDRVAAGDGDEAFVDATCDPPQTFSLGGVLAHVLTFSAVRRTIAVGALETAGVTGLGAGDPMHFVGGTGPDAADVRRHFA